MIKLYFSTVKILAQRPTHISAVATVLLRERDRDRQTDRQTDRTCSSGQKARHDVTGAVFVQAAGRCSDSVCVSSLLSEFTSHSRTCLRAPETNSCFGVCNLGLRSIQPRVCLFLLTGRQHKQLQCRLAFFFSPLSCVTSSRSRLQAKDMINLQKVLGKWHHK